MSLFGNSNQTIRVSASFPDADGIPVDQEISVTINVPKEMPASDLKSVVESATTWCQEMAKGLSKVLWEHSDRL